MRVGFGYDLHRLVKKRRFLLGGVEIPHSRGEAGHSDGDVLIHAVIDAFLGASGHPDIGTLFPPGDMAYKDISSRRLLARVMELVREKGFLPINLDCTVVLEKPKLKPFIPEIRRLLASDLGLPEEDVGIKAKTKEKTGVVGRGRAVEAYAVVLLTKK